MADLDREIQLKEEEISERLKGMRDEALRRFEAINGPSSLHKFHAHIGRNNNTFVDSVRMQFQSSDDFIARWLDGLRVEVLQNREVIARRRRFGGMKRTVELIPEMLQDEFLRNYIYLFLERNFYRNFVGRVRAKPEECLWQLWFGPGNLSWGLFISPAHRLGEWTNDKSQMRREPYHYWTIGHVMETGLVVPDSEEPMTFGSVGNFLQFYETVLARVSNSEYEKQISKLYLDHVKQSAPPEGMPLLIPELRYGGKEAKHLYRLDFCVLNPYIMRMVGFEISPASSHMAIAGITSKTQVQLNESLATKWAKESDKRNRYFRDFGISVVTFADPELADIESCFTAIVSALEERPENIVTLGGAEAALQEAFDAIEL
ncbi:hypothetical protein [Acidithiobacillus ferrianus]|uniref:hypothetical protein n=1 Tax=Acidithiobacillus ferrianus TaxID=2678518 RepID=UPI0034E3E3D4